MNKYKPFLFASSILLLSHFNVTANNNIWNYTTLKNPIQNPISQQPTEGKLIQLDVNTLKAFLNQAGELPSAGVKLSLPTPDGKTLTFNVWNTPVLESELSKSTPEIQTFTGSNVDDASITLKLDYGPMGVHASIYTYNTASSYNIDPTSYVENGIYNLYYKKDLKPSLNLSGPCNTNLVDELLGITPTPIQPSDIYATTLGNKRYKYRAAISCTGEYAALVTGSTNPNAVQVLGIIASTINRANGIWERELSISLSLINNNLSIIYTNGGSDPYTDADKEILINEGQNNITNILGTGSFDVGHVLSSVGGGLAAVRSVCASGSKASGVSGSTGSNDIGTILHEVGHQLGAMHVFNSESGGCDGNISSETAVEPGSGTSIMSYNGACGADNTPSVATDYYNQVNLREMSDFIKTSIPTCGTSVNGQNPVILPNVDERYIIPANTPFELIAPEATKTVSTNGTIFYSWEQNDIGNDGAAETSLGNATSGAILSSFDPDSSRSRSFPTLNVLKAGNYFAVGQRLPLKNRNLTFKLTARNVASDGYGTFSVIDSVVKIKVVQSGAGDFRVTEVVTNNNNEWNPGETRAIKWTKGNTMVAADSVNTGFVNIYLSKDGGSSFPILLATNVPNSGTYNVLVPNVYATNARVKVKGVGNIFFDVSKVNFKINGDPTSIKNMELDQVINVFPNPATSTVTIQNQSQDKFKVQLMNALGQKVWEGNMNKDINVNVSNYAKGVYYFYIQNESNSQFIVKPLSIR